MLDLPAKAMTKQVDLAKIPKSVDHGVDQLDQEVVVEMEVSKSKLASIHDLSKKVVDKYAPYSVPVPRQSVLHPIILRKARSHWGVLHCFPASPSTPASTSDLPSETASTFQISLIKDQYWVGRYNY